ncbi:MAG TPA: ribonuclease III [Mycobacteriales bacterium]|jgi:ribonuclease-3|nr:ribonuclease III [Mycobacteriales bacterium]
MPEGELLAGLIEALGGDVGADVVDLAITHRSFAYENGGVPTNERLEFLGDSVLGVIITEELYRRFPALAEGQLAKLRAAVVNARALAGVGREIGLGAYLKLGRGEETTGGRDKSSILADALEAVIGAYYLDRGLEPTRLLVLRLFAAAMDEAAGLGAGLDWKTSLQELAAVRGLGSPEYAVEESGPDHAKSFRATALLGGDPVGEGAGNSKKEAEQGAAEQAWTALSAVPLDTARAGSAPTDSA